MFGKNDETNWKSVERKVLTIRPHEFEPRQEEEKLKEKLRCQKRTTGRNTSIGVWTLVGLDIFDIEPPVLAENTSLA